MSNYNRIAAEFGRVGASDGALLDKAGLQQALDSIIQNNLNTAEFNKDLAE